MRFTVRNRCIPGPNGHQISLDATYNTAERAAPLVIFCHGFKGYKDWGHFPLLDRPFADAGLALVRMNFSHNGTTPHRPREFVDLEAFGDNSLSKELDDLGAVIDWLLSPQGPIPQHAIDPARLYLLGHSRGGGTVLLKAAEDPRVKKVVTWAAISDLKKRFREADLETWREEGVLHIYNSRTEQRMPMYYKTWGPDFENPRTTIPARAKEIEQPVLLLQGSDDTTVSEEEARELNGWIRNSRLKVLPGGDHTFGGYEPYHRPEMPPLAQQATKLTLDFFQSADTD